MSEMLMLNKVYPVIAAVKTQKAFEHALNSKAKTVALLKGDICSLEQTIKTAHAAGKRIFLHLELIDGLSKDEQAVRYIQQVFNPNGIITTKPSIIKICKQINLTSVFRVFTFDNLSLYNAINTVNSISPERVEVLPGIIPSTLNKLNKETSCKMLIAGGLIENVKQVEEALSAGAVAVSTSCEVLWSAL